MKLKPAIRKTLAERFKNAFRLASKLGTSGCLAHPESDHRENISWG